MPPGAVCQTAWPLQKNDLRVVFCFGKPATSWPGQCGALGRLALRSRVQSAGRAIRTTFRAIAAPGPSDGRVGWGQAGAQRAAPGAGIFAGVACTTRVLGCRPATATCQRSLQNSARSAAHPPHARWAWLGAPTRWGGGAALALNTGFCSAARWGAGGCPGALEWEAMAAFARGAGPYPHPSPAGEGAPPGSGSARMARWKGCRGVAKNQVKLASSAHAASVCSSLF